MRNEIEDGMGFAGLLPYRNEDACSSASAGSTTVDKLPFKAWVIKRLCLTWSTQGHGAPIIDKCGVRDEHGNCYHGFAILLKPWKRNKHGEHLMNAFVIAWRS